ncbi:MAG: hypothetical protein KDA55_02730 [Planctomycetales bacterium]|nr:hypothetical protein [Planctomycetales bacterium]
MPRLIIGDETRRSRHPALVTELANELRASRRCGQPIIHEQRFPRTDVIRTTVIWDQWDGIEENERVDVILQAYEDAEGKAFRDRVMLAIGLTTPEARDAGLLPVQVTAAVRSSDPVSVEDCQQAMIDVGASTLESPKFPQLRFATIAEAEQCVKELVSRLPASQPLWIIATEGAQR